MKIQYYSQTCSEQHCGHTWRPSDLYSCALFNYFANFANLYPTNILSAGYLVTKDQVHPVFYTAVKSILARVETRLGRKEHIMHSGIRDVSMGDVSFLA
jgi:hypothetical protein